MKRWAVFWACLSVVPISFDANPEPAHLDSPPVLTRTVSVPPSRPSIDRAESADSRAGLIESGVPHHSVAAR